MTEQMSTDPEFLQLFLRAYSQGAFLMGDEEEGSLAFYTADPRSLIPIDGIRVSRSLSRRLKKRETQFTFDQNLPGVINACREHRDDGQWILPEFIPLYQDLARLGFAHSCEAWRHGKLAGGVYGIALGGCFFGESMFTRAADAGKEALFVLVHQVRTLGFKIFDSQFINPHTASLGAYEVPASEFVLMLEEALHLSPGWSGQLAFDLDEAIISARRTSHRPFATS